MVRITGYQPRILDTVIYVTSIFSHTLAITMVVLVMHYSAKEGAGLSGIIHVGFPRGLLDKLSCVVGSSR